MGAAKSESDSLKQMDHVFRRCGLIEFRGRDSWTEAKAKALETIRTELGGPISSILDLGPGSLCPLQAWDNFSEVDHYVGVEGSEYIVGLQRQRFPLLDFVRAKFSEFLKNGPDPAAFSLVLALDMLYHIPEDLVHDELLERVFLAQDAVLLTYSPVVQEFGGTQVGQGGYAWFPRPEVGDFIEAKLKDGWREVYRATFSGGPQQQQLVGLVRG